MKNIYHWEKSKDKKLKYLLINKLKVENETVGNKTSKFQN